ncbi:uncharacterized protein BCR38DRAFT_482459 [Pseudomassariella vexata]|uniref:Major facilitator superfamily domain-containing protein n=1 Tax=Pseudomassariella vexata TaxID=1141098 RepID=A0A1Y2EBN3_9PEZI|nr:uncharacterized protein BCR38DRAFT_482459 [Pseudomassariella vexata]ORY68983.1 hypothetical protein BCR38DRAFT_482459 [Pseudomassariella vexata]
MHAYSTLIQAFTAEYLLEELEFSESLVSMVLLAGPLAGLVAFPVFGVLRDQHVSRFGKRVPFIVGGALVLIGLLPPLAFARKFAGAVMAVFNVDGNGWHALRLAQVVATICVYGTNFALQALNGGPACSDD